jgi:hypothetical protein
LPLVLAALAAVPFAAAAAGADPMGRVQLHRSPDRGVPYLPPAPRRRW